MILTEQFQEWKNHPVTKELFTELKRIKNSILDQMANGNTLGHDADATHAFTHRAVGQLDGLNQLLNISFDGEVVTDEVDEVSGY